MEDDMAEFDRDKLITTLLGRLITIEAKHESLQTAFFFLLSKTHPVLVDKMTRQYQDSIEAGRNELLISFPEIDQAIRNRINKDLDI